MVLEGKRALVTGGAVRIGGAIVRALQDEGVEVVVHYRKSGEEAKALSPYTVQADLSVMNEVSSLIDQVGPLDILINNASLFTKDRLLDASPDRVLKEFNVNLLAPMELMRSFAQQCEQGAVINLLDRRIRANDPNCLPYSVTKKGLAALTQLAALDLAPNIRVNGVAPGPILPAPDGSEEDFEKAAGKVPVCDTRSAL